MAGLPPAATEDAFAVIGQDETALRPGVERLCRACSPEGRTDRTDSSAVRMSRRYHFLVDRVVHVPYTVEQDETGWWSAHASLPGGGANGEGQTAEEAVADLREALDGWFAEFGVPDELTITVRDVA
jgi:predicted RNase H-like HicB family nuclease